MTECLHKHIHKIRFLLFTFFTAVILTGCTKGSINGELDGMWRIISIENLETGEISEPDQHFYCFYLHTVNLTTGPVFATANMTYSYPIIRLEFPLAASGSLTEWGIYSNLTEFNILQLTKSDLIIQSDIVNICLKKF